MRCPSCLESLELVDEVRTGRQIHSGLLFCNLCEIVVPIVNGFPLFGETRSWNTKLSTANWLSELKNEKFSLEKEYVAFLQEKQRRGATDTYAAFQPFNESTRSLYPFISLLREILNPGDIILDTWCRTGWSGELLAGLFPNQRVFSLWEGDSNVLGFRGFDYWLGSARRLPNLEVIFTHPDKALPLATDSVRVVHGLDSLHRYDEDVYLDECLRVCDSRGLLIFPHIHLTNSEPEPFFERGCMQFHGREWKARVDSQLHCDSRRCWILPEVELFESDLPLRLIDNHETSHYNGLLIIGTKELDGVELDNSRYLPLTQECRLVLNPLLNIDPNQGTISRSADQLAGQGTVILARHPCYDAYLKELEQPPLTGEEARLLWHAQKGLTIKAISVAMNASAEFVLELSDSLRKRELVHSSPISEAMWNLQNFYGFVRFLAKAPHDFSMIWRDLSYRYASVPIIQWLQDGSELFFDDVDFLVKAARMALRERDIKEGDRVALASGHHPGALVLCWACWLEGVCVVVLEEGHHVDRVKALQRSCKADWIFTDKPSLVLVGDERAVLFDIAEIDDLSSVLESQLFSSFLETCEGEITPETKTNPNSDAVVLFSSGSSGEAKRIVLSQNALCNSAFNMVETFNWNQEKLFSLGPFSMMSGLRNAMVSSLVSTSTILLPSAERLMPINAWQLVIDWEASVITTVPSWLEKLIWVGNRLPSSKTLKQVLVTGSPLKESVSQEFARLTGVVVEDYYGLTETGGLCIATQNSNAFVPKEENCIGYPAGSLVRIVDENGQLGSINEVGSLQIYSDQLMDRYLDDPGETKKIFNNGWLVTGDLAHWDTEGRVCLHGRDDDLMKLRDGRRVHPSTFERWLCELPGVRDAAVIVIEPFQSLLGLVVTQEPVQELLNTLRSRYPDQRLPDKLTRVSSLPYNRNGKLQRGSLHELVDSDGNAH